MAPTERIPNWSFPYPRPRDKLLETLSWFQSFHSLRWRICTMEDPSICSDTVHISVRGGIKLIRLSLGIHGGLIPGHLPPRDTKIHICSSPLYKMSWGTSLVVQWLGVPLQGAQVWFLVRKLRSHKPSGTADKVKENTMVLHIIYVLQTQVLFGESCKFFFLIFFDPPLVEFTDIRLYPVLKFWRNRRVYL